VNEIICGEFNGESLADVTAKRLTGQESTHAKGWLEASLLCRLHVLQAQLDIQGIREHDSLLFFDANAIIELSHHLDKPNRVARVLTHSGERLSI